MLSQSSQHIRCKRAPLHSKAVRPHTEGRQLGQHSIHQQHQLVAEPARSRQKVHYVQHSSMSLMTTH